LLASWENSGREKFSVGKMLKPIKRNIAKQLATTVVGRTTGEKKNFFLVAICFCYLLEVTAPK
jgi:hypothetical protein